MLNALDLEQSCVRDYSKYADTVAISCAIYDFFSKNPQTAKFVGIERSFRNVLGKNVTPDISATYGNDSKGLLLEIKWSLPFDEKLLEKEIEELEKYTILCPNLRNSGPNVVVQDLVLICHIDDAQRTIEMIKRISKVYPFLEKEGFAVWSWSLTMSKQGERKEEMRLFSLYGNTRNEKLEALVKQPGGILFSEDALTYLRFTFTFIKEKPPIQYTMTVLIQNILSSFQRGPEREFQDIHIDMIYDRAKSFFPSWHHYDSATIQIKRKWIREALEGMCALGLCSQVPEKDDWWKIKIPLISTRKPVQEELCKKIAKANARQAKIKKRGRPRTSVSRPRSNPNDKTITSYF